MALTARCIGGPHPDIKNRADIFIACEDGLKVEHILERGVDGIGVPHDTDQAITKQIGSPENAVTQGEKCRASRRR